MKPAPTGIRCALSLLAILFASSHAHEERKAAVTYTLTFAPRDAEAAPFTRRPTWQLQVKGKHFDAEDGAICLVFDSWGNWREIDSLYLDVLHAEPAVDAELLPGNALVLQLPDQWQGDFCVDFEITPVRAGTQANERWGMLPRWSPSYSFGQTRNVFPKVYQDAGEVQVDAELHIGGTYGMEVATGWDGNAAGTRALQLNPTRGNGFLAFGSPSARASRSLTHGQLQVLQYGKSRAIADPIAELVGPLAESMASALSPHRDPLIVFISDVGGGGMGTDFGLVLGYEPDAPDWLVGSPYYQHFVAHELFHHWLGSQLRGSERFTWFHEGFTDYFALWHLAAVGGVEQAWFGERMRELGEEAIEKSSWGELAFADADVQWRDGDGPNETMAYKGGAVLAWALDLELRERGQPGALQMLRDFLDSGASDVTLEALEQWCRDNDCGDFWDRFVAGKEIPDLDALLERARELPHFFEFTARD